MKSIVTKKLKAGALQYTLFVAVLIVILIATFLTLTYLQSQFRETSNFKIQSIQNTTIGFDYLQNNDISYNQEKKLELNSAIKSQLVLTKKHWGIFDILDVTSTVQKSTFQKIGLIGGYQLEKPALYLKDNNKALVLVGETQIQGTAFLPQKGVKRGNIAGRSYYRKQLIYGNTTQSQTTLPKIKNRAYIEQLSKGLIDLENTEYFELFEDLKSANSFHKKTLIYKQNGVINLYDIQLTGNFIIQSDTLIKINSTAFLNDVLLIAPNIEITDNVIGNFQAIATKSITVGNNCNLMYPSAIVLAEQEKSNDKSKKDDENLLVINSNSSVKGVVAFLSKDEQSNYNPQLIVDENAIITGEVFCDKNLELKGTVNGSVYVNNFITKQFGSVYQNHIYNGSIIQNQLPEQYVGITIENTTTKLSKWLY